MKIKYQFATETVEIEVSEEWGNVIVDLDRLEYNNDHKETRRHCSLEAYNLDDALLPSDVDVLGDILRHEEEASLHEAMSHLSDRHQYLIREVFYKRRKYTEIAREEDRDESSIRESVNRALKNLKKYLQK